MIIKRLYEDNVTGKLTDERFIKLFRDYEFEQDNLKTTAETMRQELKQQEQKKGNVKSFIITTKKYTNLRELDATVLREFADRIFISATEKGNKTNVGCRIHMVYNFIDAFDFEAAAQAEIDEKNRKRHSVILHRFLSQKLFLCGGGLRPPFIFLSYPPFPVMPS